MELGDRPMEELLCCTLDLLSEASLPWLSPGPAVPLREPPEETPGCLLLLCPHTAPRLCTCPPQETSAGRLCSAYSKGCLGRVGLDGPGGAEERLGLAGGLQGSQLEVTRLSLLLEIHEGKTEVGGREGREARISSGQTEARKGTSHGRRE